MGKMWNMGVKKEQSKKTDTYISAPRLTKLSFDQEHLLLTAAAWQSSCRLQVLF